MYAMNKEVNVPALAAQMLYGRQEETERCRICLNVTSPTEVWLDDEVRLETPCISETVTVGEILSEVTRCEFKTDSVLPNTVCSSCTYSAISSYEFIKLCEDSKKHWNNIHNAISKGLVVSEIQNPTTTSLFVFISPDDSKILVNKNEAWTGVKDASKRVKKVLKNELMKSKKVEREEYKDLFQCADCGRMFRNEYLLKKHMAVHLQDLQCHFCGKVCGNKPRLNVHIARLHKEKKYRCNFCPKRFGSEYLVSEHQKVMHCQGSCKFCGKTYMKKSTLRAHEDSHTNWTCNVCRKSYKYKQTLKTHTCINSIDKQYSCNECGRAYTAKNSLRTHILHDHGENPYKCNVCEKKFFNRRRLVDHLAVHTGVKNYVCELCKGSFMSKSILLRHTRAIHTGEKPFKCDKCEQCFVSSHRRLEHQRRDHDAPAPFCSVCNRKFTAFADLRKHLKKHADPSSKLYRVVFDAEE